MSGKATPSPGDDPEACLTQRQLAARWNMSPRSLERWRREHYGLPWLIIGGSVRYKLADVVSFERARRVDPRP